jgi:hypothetical protein
MGQPDRRHYEVLSGTTPIVETNITVTVVSGNGRCTLVMF